MKSRQAEKKAIFRKLIGNKNDKISPFCNGMINPLRKVYANTIETMLIFCNIWEI